MIKAHHRFARISPTKVRPFADMIRGMTVQQGLDSLRYVPNRGARMLEKVVRSAVANAEDRGARHVDRLRIVESHVDGGPMFKRIHARARGMAYLIRKRSCHIHVTVHVPELT